MFTFRRTSTDGWTFELRQAEGALEKWEEQPQNDGRTLLFSGGLDSFAAAVEYGENNSSLQLVSHRTHNTVTSRAQDNLLEMLKNADYELPHVSFLVSSRTGGPSNLIHDQENSQRTRSFLFLVLGALVARRRGHPQIIFLAENGQLAINLPLSVGRVGANSTHTAHPEVLLLVRDFLREALGTDVTIENPYVYRTKREVVEPVFNRLPEALPIANSCWRNSRLSGGATHCGECIPCFIRRISIESFCADETLYAKDPWSTVFSDLPPEDIGRRNLADFAEFIKIFETSSEEDIMSQWPELYSLNSPEIIDMYRRFAEEARAVLANYPGLAPILL